MRHHSLQAAALRPFSSTPPSKIKTAIFGSAPRVVSCASPSRNCTMSPRVDSPSFPPSSLAKGTACVPANAAEPPTQRPREPPTVPSGSPPPRASSTQPPPLTNRPPPLHLPPLPLDPPQL